MTEARRVWRGSSLAFRCEVVSVRPHLLLGSALLPVGWLASPGAKLHTSHGAQPRAGTIPRSSMAQKQPSSHASPRAPRSSPSAAARSQTPFGQQHPLPPPPATEMLLLPPPPPQANGAPLAGREGEMGGEGEIERLLLGWGRRGRG